MDLLRDLSVKSLEIGHTYLFGFHTDLLAGMDLKSTPGHGDSIPLPTPFTESEVGNFHHL